MLVLIGGWWVAAIAVVGWHARIPWFVSLPLLAILGALHGSLQHEAIHGHPTASARVNALLVGVPATLWCPYPEYRTSHLAHHASELTVPGLDPESFYVDAVAWERAGALRRSALRANRTLLGRLALGPVMVIAAALGRAAGSWRSPAARLVWAGHLVAASVLAWLVVGVAGLPWWEWLVGGVYAGTSLTLLRSFVEHRAPQGDTTACAVVHSRWLAMLFLHNNLHHTHHAVPGAPWYELPRLHVALGSDDQARAGAGLYASYGEVARRYLVQPFDRPVHPGVTVDVR